ncbi:MAG: hypothetical protein JXO22_09520 [Phycisphaerae bacterium]|nr:hypothetical protein [Phycisphaerae bacterium]
MLKKVRWTTGGLLALLLGLPMATTAQAADGYSASSLIDAIINLIFGIVDVSGDS